MLTYIKSRLHSRLLGTVAAALVAGIAISADDKPKSEDAEEAAPAQPVPMLQPGMVNCGNLVYGNGKTSVCFSNEFLSQIGEDSHVIANPGLIPVHLESSEMFQFPFAVMTGEGAFSLTDAQRVNMRNYLENGGFIIASAGCSSDPWQNSFRTSISQVFPDYELTRIDPSHPVYHTVYEIDALRCKGNRTTHLEGLEIDGKIVLIFSPDGLNDTGKVGGSCCCCGGSEILNARQMNVNLLAYTLTH